MSHRDLWLSIQCSLMLVLLALSGCSSGGTGAVTGRATFQGKPVVYGSVVMVGADDKLVSGPLDAEGRFAINGVPIGTVKAAVVSPHPDSRRRIHPIILKRLEKKVKLVDEKKNVEASPGPEGP